MHIYTLTRLKAVVAYTLKYSVLFYLVAPPSVSAMADTTALWLFDEPLGTYPSSVLDSSSENDYPLVLGSGGQLVAGVSGNALSITNQPAIGFPSGSNHYGLRRPWQVFFSDNGKMYWHNSRFAALMTDGEKHLRKEVGFVSPVDSRLNLGDFDWTVEFWFRLEDASSDEGVVFELGLIPNAENQGTTSLSFCPKYQCFVFRNGPSGTELSIASDKTVWNGRDKTWHHCTFVFSAKEDQLRHYVDGQLQPLPDKHEFKSLPSKTPSYFSLGRNKDWRHPLPGAIDELRFSVGEIYQDSFQPPDSFALDRPGVILQSGPRLLFDNTRATLEPVHLGNRKHLFIDDALLLKIDGADFVVNPPQRAELVIGDIRGAFRKHLTVVADTEGLIRIYNSLENDQLAVRVSQDGIHFTAPGDSEALSKIVIPEMVGGLGNPFIDANGPDEERWKYLSDYHRRGVYLYTSPDGYDWKRNKTATLPFRSGTQSCTFYDDQRQCYVSYHRSGIHETPAGDTERSSVVTEHRDLAKPVEFTPLSQSDYWQRQAAEAIRDPLPWYLDNGPLTPGGFGLEFPHAFRPISVDPPGTDIYVTKAQKYPWAPDTYLAFPIVYFHYWPDGPTARHALADPLRGRGSGSVETQLAVSRNGKDWERFPRPAYVGIGEHAGRDVVNAYIAHGMVRRGDEIWQYYFGETQYHSAYRHDPTGRGVYRLVQRLDGFVSLDSPYDDEAVVITRPLTFEGNRLTLNIDTDATGYAQIGLLDEQGAPISGFSVDECVYVNGDFIDTEIAWIEQGSDLSGFQGKTIQLEIRMRGSKLYALQFVDR
ncbi:LamG domain-containing protein [Bythopirellula goksoeyrii]|nr:LamG domain-containing protein [Bythopirellula goksoeyrii]